MFRCSCPDDKIITMNKSLAMLMVIGISVLGCGESGPDLAISNIQVVAPAPGRTASVAYLTVHNQGGKPAALTSVSSLQFARIEMHQTDLKDGVARMQALDTVIVDAKGKVDFVPGGRHLMLFEPTAGLMPGKNISLAFHFDTGAILTVESPLKTRIKTD